MEALYGMKILNILLKFLTLIIIFSTLGCRQIVDPLCLYFTLSPSSFNDIYTMRYRCGASYNSNKISISADGKKIVFGCTITGNEDICIIDADGKNLKSLTTNNAYDGDPSFSPDGDKIVFTSERDEGLNIYTINIDGSNLNAITNNTFYKSSPTFSPDGTYIVYMREVEKPGMCIQRTSQLFRIDLDGNNNKLIETDDVGVGGPSFSGDGKKIIYTGLYCEKGKNYYSRGLKLLKLDDGNHTEILKGNINVFSSNISKNGNKVIFSADITSEKSFDLRLYEMDINTLEIRKIFDHDARSPSYINNDKKILFFIHKNRHGGDICTINSDGSDFQVITSTYKLNSD